jgi:hypothetical protein
LQFSPFSEVPVFPRAHLPAAVLVPVAEVLVFAAITLGGGFGGTPGAGYDGYGNRANGLRGGFRADGGRDVWGHWGAYYRPMIPMI